MSKKTLVVGASENPTRYSHRAVRKLSQHEHEVLGLNIKPGKIGDIDIVTEVPENSDIHTVTVYIEKDNQDQLMDLIKEIEPQRVIFNPGAENQELSKELESLGIETIEACTLVMLNIGNY